MIALTWRFWADVAGLLTIGFLAVLFYLLWTNQKADEWMAEQQEERTDE